MSDPPKPKRKPSFGCIMGLVLLSLVIAYIGTCGIRTQRALDRRTREMADARRREAEDALRTHQNRPLGMDILKDYGEASTSPEQDLTDLSHALGNFALLVKGTNPLPLGANEDIATALRGRNKAKLRFLPDDAPCFNAQGQLVDRWQTPLFFHANDQQRLDIRSAGPDRQMWTADDIHRRYDGQFVKGDALNSPSLFDATRDYHPK